MSLMRAFTTRLNKHDDVWKTLHLGRTSSQRVDKPLQRGLISGPVELVSTTNMLSYDAPDIAGTKPIVVRKASTSVSDGSVSGEDSDRSALSIRTDISMTDASSVEQSPTTPEPKENHLSCYFKPAVDTQSSASSPITSSRPSFDAPAIPQRMPSHSKKAHERLHRQRSIQRIVSPSSRRASAEVLERAASPDLDFPRESPFSTELAQLDEIAEEFAHSAMQDAEEEDFNDQAAIKSLNLAVFIASDYEAEIAVDLLRTYYSEPPVWI